MPKDAVSLLKRVNFVGESFYRVARWLHRNRFWVYPSAFVLSASAAMVKYELDHSSLQSRFFASAARNSEYNLTRHCDDVRIKADQGPYDVRLGYAQTNDITNRLEGGGFTITHCRRGEPPNVAGYKLSPIYTHKAQTGLKITGSEGNLLYESRYPGRVYKSFRQIPPLIYESLSLIEDRALLEYHPESWNPAINYSRSFKALTEKLMNMLGFDVAQTGGSTLAIQLYKMRHFPDGVTQNMGDKAYQMLMASLEAYTSGIDTREDRERIITEYINNMPLAATPGYGEVTGFGDGIHRWFGADFDRLNNLLRFHDTEAFAQLDWVDKYQLARGYKQSLSLILAVQRPSYFLTSQEGWEDLQTRLERFIPLLHDHGIISGDLKKAVQEIDIAPSPLMRWDRREAPVYQKAIDNVRIRLMQTVGVRSIHALDRMDFSVASTLDQKVTQDVAGTMQAFADPDQAEEMGLIGKDLLQPGQEDEVYYAFTLYEKERDWNLLRVQADNFEGQLNLNEGTKLELGSTAKARVLVSYLQIMESLFHQFSGISAQEREELLKDDPDPLTRWMGEFFIENQACYSLQGLLDAAMERRYPAHTYERFFTGEGAHRFVNFNRRYDHLDVTVRKALQESINLPFVRLLRDIIRYKIRTQTGATSEAFLKEDSRLRRELLKEFSDYESGVFLERFWQKYRSQNPESILNMLAGESGGSPAHLAALFRIMRPESGQQEFNTFVRENCKSCPKDKPLENAGLQELYEQYAAGAYSYNDLGYVTSFHPLELWTASRIAQDPSVTRQDLLSDSTRIREESYEWLFRTSRKHVQDRAIKIMLERAAFESLHKDWQALGYPFDSLVPSFATALGSSGDTPIALAELAGIIANEGIMRPTTYFREVSFAQNTPYERRFKKENPKGKRVLSEQVAKRLGEELHGVVEEGTGYRVEGQASLSDGRVLPVAMKTGTGDNRLEKISVNGYALDSKVINRTATVFFTIDDSFYGSLLVYAPNESAGGKKFTSALASQALKNIMPDLQPLFDKAYQKVDKLPENQIIQTGFPEFDPLSPDIAM